MKSLSKLLDTEPKICYLTLLLKPDQEILIDSEIPKMFYGRTDCLLSDANVTSGIGYDDKIGYVLRYSFYTNNVPLWKRFCKKYKVKYEVDE